MISKKQKEVLIAIAKGIIRGDLPFGFNKLTVRALVKYGLIEEVFDKNDGPHPYYEPTICGWQMVTNMLPRQYRETASYLATGRFKIRGRELQEGYMQFIEAGAIDIITGERR